MVTSERENSRAAGMCVNVLTSCARAQGAAHSAESECMGPPGPGKVCCNH